MFYNHPLSAGFLIGRLVSVGLILTSVALTQLSATAQALVNGGDQDGTVAIGATNTFTFNANALDHAVLEVAKTSGGAGFNPVLEIVAPSGVRLAAASASLAVRLDIQAPTAGVYTVNVSDLSGGVTGGFRLRLAQVPGSFSIPVGDEGGSVTNGAIQTGTITIGDLDLWTVSAAQGDRITALLSKASGGAGFTPMLEVFGPDGARLGVSSDSVACRLDVQAATNGTYTFLVSDAVKTGTGTYQLEVAHFPGPFVTSAGDEGGALPNLTDTPGTIAVGDFDLWSFSGSPPELFTIDVTEVTGGANFAPLIELVGPSGEIIATAQGSQVATFTVAAESPGTYVVMVSDANRTGAGTYNLRLTRGSASPPASNLLTNGLMQGGTIATAGQSNLWSFTASAGESLVIRAGETATTGFVPWLRLYSPTGVLLDSAFGAVAAEVTVRATNSGTFLLAVSDGTAARNMTGSYQITLAKTGSPVFVDAADEGGPLVNGTTYQASITAGDMDVWTFTANPGETLTVRAGKNGAGNLIPFLRLYGPNGALIDSGFSAAAAEVNVRATNAGTYILVVADGNGGGGGGTGGYRISLAKTGSPLVIPQTDEGGPLTNGITYSASIDIGDVDPWSLTANAGETLIVRVGLVTPGPLALHPFLRLYGPDGVLLSSDFNATAAEVSTRATNSGTFQVVVADGNSGLNGTGTYRISLAKTGTPFSISSSSDEGGNMVNGTTYAATIENGDIDPWTFEAVAGESIIVRMGETATASLIPWLRLYSPAGVLLNSDFNAGAAEVVTRATNSGTFLVVAGDGNAALNGTGNYRISLAKTGSELTISPNDEGGPLVNGTSYIAFIETGDIDAWSFQANAGDNILARVGEMDPASPLLPWVRLYGPTGILLSQDFRAAAAEVSTRATNGGTFLIVVGDGNANLAGTGRYRLTLAASGSPLIISDGDEGGSMNGSGTYAGQIDTGDIDAWTFTVCEGDVISASVTETVAGSPLLPWLRLYGRDGKLLQNTFGAAGASFSNFVAPETGTYQIVVADGSGTLAGSGQYQLTVNGLTDGLKFCTPIKSKTQVQLFGVGGPALGGFVLLSSQDVTTPLPSWTPVWTNNFDQFGVMTFTNPLVSPGSHAFFGLRLQ